MAFYDHIEIYEWSLTKNLLATFLSNAFALSLHHILINFIVLLILYIFLWYTADCLSSQLKDISLNAVMRCDSKNRAFSVRNLLPAGIKTSAPFFWTRISSSALWTSACFADLDSLISNEIGTNRKNLFSYLNKRTAILKGYSPLQSRLVDWIQANSWWQPKAELLPFSIKIMVWNAELKSKMGSKAMEIRNYHVIGRSSS